MPATARPPMGVDASTPLAEAIMEILKAEGVTFLSAYPTTPLINAAASRHLRPILCRQERVGVGIADGYSRVTTGRPPGVFAMQWGPGVENAYAGIATAFADSVPMLLLPLGYQEDKQDAPRFHNVDRIRPIAKSVERIRRPHRVGDVMRRAFTQLRTGRPGPVVVEVPLDLATTPVGDRFRPYQPATTCRVAGDPVAIDDAARRLVEAERPVLLAGQGVLYAQASDELVALAELLDAPVGTTLEGKSSFPEDHPLALGAGGMTMPTPLRDLLADADVVVGVGTSFTRHLMVVAPPRHASIIHITIDPTDLNKDCRADTPIIGDAGLVLAALRDAVADRLGGGPAQRGSRALVEQRRSAWLAEWEPRLRSDQRPIDAYRVVEALRTVADPSGSIVTHDSGSPRDQLLPFYRSTVPHGYLGWGKSHALGTGLGLIMGAKLAQPEKFCVNLMGDAAFGMVGLDFETAVRNEIPITTVVNNNGTMAIETEALDVAHERYGVRDIGGNYADLARAMGGWACRVEDPAGLEPALEDARRANDDGQAALVEVITSPDLTPFSARFGAPDQH